MYAVSRPTASSCGGSAHFSGSWFRGSSQRGSRTSRSPSDAPAAVTARSSSQTTWRGSSETRASRRRSTSATSIADGRTPSRATHANAFDRVEFPLRRTAMGVKIGINGFGRIGRNFFRAAKQRGSDLDLVAVNDITDSKTLAHLLRYDSVLGTFDRDIAVSENGIRVDGDELRVLAERDPASLPWKELGARIVIESTGLFTNREDADKH